MKADERTVTLPLNAWGILRAAVYGVNKPEPEKVDDVMRELARQIRTQSEEADDA